MAIIEHVVTTYTVVCDGCDRDESPRDPFEYRFQAESWLEGAGMDHYQRIAGKIYCENCIDKKIAATKANKQEAHA